MRVLLIGDPHLKINKFEMAKELLHWINGIVVEQKPDFIVNLGDTFDTHAVVRSEIMSEFMQHVDVCRRVAPYIYLLGNHDMYRPNDSKYHALSHLKDKISQFTIVDSPQILHGITFIPYQHNPSKFPMETTPICIAHQTFKGADYGGITVKDGVDADTVSAEIIISGHIHKRHEIGKVVYPGSPFAQSVSDINQVKGISIFDTNTYKFQFFQSPMPMWRGARFEITPAYTCQDLEVELGDLLKGTKDHWVIEITGPKAEITSFVDSKKTRKILDGIDVKIKTMFTDKEKKIASIKALSVDSIIKEYIDKVYSGSLDKTELNSKSMELLEKIQK